MIIDTPYINAFDIAPLREAELFVKKLTVNGSIGNMQGISKAAKPPRKLPINIVQRDVLSDEDETGIIDLTDAESANLAVSTKVSVTSLKTRPSVEMVSAS